MSTSCQEVVSNNKIINFLTCLVLSFQAFAFFQEELVINGASSLNFLSVMKAAALLTRFWPAKTSKSRRTSSFFFTSSIFYASCWKVVISSLFEQTGWLTLLYERDQCTWKQNKTKKKLVCLFVLYVFFFRSFLRGKIQFICLLINTSELLIGSRRFDYDGANWRYPSPSKLPNENNIT